MTKIISVFFIALILFVSGVSYAAKGVYQTPNAFINSVFEGKESEAKVVWLNTQDKADIADIMQHKFNRMRIRYWLLDNETVWILDEIGKEKPITIGVHIKEQKIENFKVLTFRESRGDEVRHDFYTKQFLNAALTQNNQLTQHVDGITGATLSVRATTKVARLALWLNAKVISEE